VIDPGGERRRTEVLRLLDTAVRDDDDGVTRGAEAIEHVEHWQWDGAEGRRALRLALVVQRSDQLDWRVDAPFDAHIGDRLDIGEGRRHAPRLPLRPRQAELVVTHPEQLARRAPPRRPGDRPAAHLRHERLEQVEEDGAPHAPSVCRTASCARSGKRDDLVHSRRSESVGLGYSAR
jgi:hypothetical protein